MPYRFIYFDLDDTLLNHRKAEKLALEQIWVEFDLQSLASVDQLQEIYHHINVILWEMYGRGEIDRDTLQRTRFERTLYRINSDLNWKKVGDQYIEFYQKFWEWQPGAEEAFQEIMNTYPVGILTNGFAETQRVKLGTFGLNSHKIITLISEDVGVMKPQPGIFDAATRISGVKTDEILYVGDSYSSDVLGGTGYGWDVAWFTQETDEKKREVATFCFDDFKQLLEFIKSKK